MQSSMPSSNDVLSSTRTLLDETVVAMPVTTIPMMAMPVMTMPVMAVHETRRSTRRTYKAAGRGADGSPIDKADLSARRLRRNVLCWTDSWLDMEESVVATSNLIRDPEERGVEF